jgi:MFS family permease
MSGLTGNSSGVRSGALAVLCVAQFVVVLDVTIVATALPAIAAELGFATAQQAWVITAYTVVLAGMLILGGRVADLVGARRIFSVGLVVFGAMSLACALAWTPAMLIAARVGQGAGAALLSPAALAALHELTADPGSRRRALAWWTAAAACGGAAGWVIGGAVVELAGWRWVFAVNVPLALAALLLARKLLDGIGAPPASTATHLPLTSALGATAGIGAATFGLSRLAEHPAADGWLATGLAVVVLAFVVRHDRRAVDPLVPRGVLRAPGVIGGNLTAAALTAATTPAMLMVVLYVQNTLRLSPIHGALLFPVCNVAVVAGSLLGPRALGRIGVRGALLAGFAGVVLGALLLITLPDHGSPTAILLTCFVLMGGGLGAASMASTTAGTAGVEPAERGVAAGLLTSAAQLGTGIGLAATTPLVTIDASAMTGYRLGFTAAAVVAVAGALAAFTVPRGLLPDRASTADTPA